MTIKMLRIICCGRPCFERLLQLISPPYMVRLCCGRPCFERLLQLVFFYCHQLARCGKPCFEGLLQQHSHHFTLIVMVPKSKEPLLFLKYLPNIFYHHIFAMSNIRTTLKTDKKKDWWQQKKRSYDEYIFGNDSRESSSCTLRKLRYIQP